MTQGTNRPEDPFAGTGTGAGSTTPPVYPPVREGGAGVVPGPAHEEPDTKDTAKQEASHLADTAKRDAGQVKETAKETVKDTAQEATDQAKRAATEAKNQAKDLLVQTRGELSEQTSSQQRRLADGLRSFSGELGSLADGTPQEGGLASDLARQASSYADKVGQWLEVREPGDVLDEVSRYARRHPGTFIAIAAGLGLVAGRVARSLKDSSSNEDSASAGFTSRPAPTGYRADYTTGARHQAGVESVTEYAPTHGTSTTGTTGAGYTSPYDPLQPGGQSGTGGAR